jgi:glutamate N-acetyltransferase/amino-acid N-acetyltransferase
MAKSVANSALVKTAFYGQDANWGRVLCAVGYSGEEVDPLKTNLWMEAYDDDIQTQHRNTHNVCATEGDGFSRFFKTSMQLVENGQPLPLDEARAGEMLKHTNIGLVVDLGLGQANTTFYTCDFSTEYVHINADYRSWKYVHINADYRS